MYRGSIKPYKGNDAREKLLSAVESVLDKEVEKGFVLVLLPDSSWDFVHGVKSINQVRDALLNYARDLAVYEGD